MLPDGIYWNICVKKPLHRKDETVYSFMNENELVSF